MPTVIKGSGDSTFGGTIQTTGIDDNATSIKITTTSTGIDVTGSVTCDDVNIGAANKIYLDGGSNTYLSEVSDGDIRVYSNGSSMFDFISSGAGVSATKKLYIDGGGDTYISEVSANTMALTTGGSERMRIDSAGRVTMPYQPSFRVYLGSTQSISASTQYIVAFNTENYDDGNNFNTSTYRFTAPVSGMYMFTGHILFDTSSSLHRGSVKVLKNWGRLAATQLAIGGYSSDSPHCGGVYSTLAKLSANDYIEVQASSNTYGGSFYSSSDWTYFSGYLIG